MNSSTPPIRPHFAGFFMPLRRAFEGAGWLEPTMTDKPKYTMLTMNDFKTKLCEYMRRLHAGDEEYIVRRYGKPVAFVLSVRKMELANAAAKDERELKRYFAAVKRHEEQRRLIRARLLSWPGRACYERCLAAEAESLAQLYRDTYGKY